MNVAVIYGGKSGEHDVSRVSAASVVRNLDGSKYNVTVIGITKSGEWFLQPDADVAATAQKGTLGLNTDPQNAVMVVPGAGTHCFSVAGVPLTIDVVFPVLHGTFGEDGTIQGLFEMCNVPYVGGGVMASSIAMDKEKTKQVWMQSGLPVVPYLAVRSCDWNKNSSVVIAAAEKQFTYPLFVKPACAGSSVGAQKAADSLSLATAITEAFRWDTKILIEPFICAREIECSVTGNDIPVSYTPGEIATGGSHEFYDYDAKYTDPDGAQLYIPANLEEKTMAQIKLLAEKAYAALNLSGLSRCDFFMDKTTGKIMLNEINTIPGFTSISMFPKMCEASGLAYSDLLSLLIDLAIERFSTRKNLVLESL